MRKLFITALLTLFVSPIFAQTADDFAATIYESLNKKQDYVSALQTANAAIAKYPNEATFYFLRGSAFFSLKKYDEAIADATKALAIKPKYGDAWLLRGKVYEEVQKYGQAIDDFRWRAANEPKEDNLFLLGNEINWMLSSIITADSAAISALTDENKKGLIKTFEVAVRSFTKVIALNPINNLAYSGRANAYRAITKLGIDKTREAINDQNYATGLKLVESADVPGDTSDKSTKKLADFLDKIHADEKSRNDRIKENKWTLAQDKEYLRNRSESIAFAVKYDCPAYIKTISAPQRKYDAAYLACGELINNQSNGDFRTAVDLLGEAAKGEFQAAAVTQIARDFFFLNDANDALTFATEAIKLNPNNAVAYNVRGLAYTSKSDNDKALADLNEAVRILPNARHLRSRGFILARKNNYADALRDYDKAVSLEPFDSSFPYQKATAYYGLNNFDQVIADTSKALELNPNYEDSLFLRGYAYERVGKLVEASADFDRLIDNAPTEKNYIRAGNAGFLGFTENLKKYEGHEKEPVFAVFVVTARVLLNGYIKDYFNKALLLNPNSIEAYQGRAAIYRAFSTIGDDKTKEAEADERKVAELKGL